MRFLKPVVSVVLLCSFLSPVNASDLLREKRMADEIVDAIIDGDPVYLKADGHEFLNIYTEADEPKGAVIIFHGRGFHPDWQDAINPLRVGLSESGWNTLSVQMPVLEKGSKYNDYVPLFPEASPRIDAALKFVNEHSKGKVVIVAHSCSVHMVMAWIDLLPVNLSQKIDAFVGIGMGSTDYRQPLRQPVPYEKLTVPVLDVYGENDHSGVIRMAPERLRLLKISGNKNIDQRVIADANHYYVNRGEELTNVIDSWLDEL